MFLRVVRAKSGGVQREYLRLVEAFRENGKTKHRTIVNLGRKDLLAPHAQDLLRILTDAPRRSAVSDANAVGAWDWGPVLVARHLWCELGLDKVCVRSAPAGRYCGQDCADRMFALVANRLCYPTSEHGLARWLETDFVCDSQGQRWEPAWRSEAERLNSKLPRVRVQMKQLKSWYRALDGLFSRKKLIEVELFASLRTLFALKVDLVFYDLTSTYFEGAGPPTLGAFGYSRDKRPRNRQVEIGMVMVDGWPIAHHVFAGNVRDECTVSTVLKDLQARFGIGRIIFVGDRGMITSDNLALIRSSKQGYVMGLPRRRRPDVYALVQKATGPWLPCTCGITNREKKRPYETKVQEVPTSESGVRVFVVHSDERLEYERTQRTKAMAKVREELSKLSERIANNKLRAPEKIGASATRILQRHHGYRYYDWSYKQDQFSFFEHPVNLPREIACEGKYIIQTEEKNLTAQQAVDIYKQLTEVERSFRCLKDVFDLRPVYHQTDRRVEAHVFVATLAFVLHRALEKKLRAHAIDISASEALTALRTVRVVDLAFADGSTKRCVTKGSARAAAILRAVGIEDLMPPCPNATDVKEVPVTP